jgi:hypothetical protein
MFSDMHQEDPYEPDHLVHWGVALCEKAHSLMRERERERGRERDNWGERGREGEREKWEKEVTDPTGLFEEAEKLFILALRINPRYLLSLSLSCHLSLSLSLSLFVCVSLYIFILLVNNKIKAISYLFVFLLIISLRLSLSFSLSLFPFTLSSYLSFPISLSLSLSISQGLSRPDEHWEYLWTKGSICPGKRPFSYCERSLSESCVSF